MSLLNVAKATTESGRELLSMELSGSKVLAGLKKLFPIGKYVLWFQRDLMPNVCLELGCWLCLLSVGLLLGHFI